MNGRIGKIIIKRELIRDELNSVRKMFSILGFVPYEITNKFIGTVEYIGFSDSFEILPEGCVVPEYNLTFIVNMYGEIEDVETERKELK